MSSGNRLRELREAQGWTPRELADRLAAQPSGKRLSVRTIARWEAEGRIPDFRKAELADLFGVSISFLMRWPQEDNDGKRDGNQHDDEAVA